MRALVKSKAEPGIWMAEVPEPSIGPNDLLVRVRATSICGTDLHIWKWDAWARETIRIPRVIGHEFMGEVSPSARRSAGSRSASASPSRAT